MLLNWNGDSYSDLAVTNSLGGAIYDGQALSRGETRIVNSFSLDETDRVQLVRRTFGLAEAVQVESFRQANNSEVTVEFPGQYNNLDSIAFDPETGHIFGHQFDIDQIAEFDLEGNLVNSWDGLPHMAEEGGISITSAPMLLGDTPLPAHTLLLFLGNTTSSRNLLNEINGVDDRSPGPHLVIAYDKFTGERLAVLETDLPAGPPDYVQLEAGFYHPHRNTLFALTSEGNVHEIDPSSGESLNSFAVPFQNLGGGFATRSRRHHSLESRHGQSVSQRTTTALSHF